MFTVLICGNIKPEKLLMFSKKVKVSANDFEYYPIEIIPPFCGEPLDLEVSKGATHFYKKMNCNYMAYLNCLPESNKNIKYSCSEISEDLTNYFVKAKRNSIFLDFINALDNSSILNLAEELYFVFCDEWNEKQDIRLLEVSFHEVTRYFVDNNSWDLWLYDVENSQYVTKNHFIPLVFKLLNTMKNN